MYVCMHARTFVHMYVVCFGVRMSCAFPPLFRFRRASLCLEPRDGAGTNICELKCTMPLSIDGSMAGNDQHPGKKTGRTQPSGTKPGRTVRSLRSSRRQLRLQFTQLPSPCPPLAAVRHDTTARAWRECCAKPRASARVLAPPRAPTWVVRAMWLVSRFQVIRRWLQRLQKCTWRLNHAASLPLPDARPQSSSRPKVSKVF